MVRASTAANAAHALTAVTISNGLAFQRRLTTGGESAHTAGPAGTAPYWVRLVRSGNSFTSFVSTNGTSWTQVGSATTITMTSSVQVGLAVTSHNNTALSTATFDNVSVTSGTVAVTGVTVSPTSASINTGATQQLTATVAPSNATNKNVTWTTSNSSVATVSTNGLVTGVAAGNATITVTTQDGNRTATSSITVTSTPSTNIARNKPAVASSLEDATFPASLAVDGNGATRWASLESDAQWIYVDLSANYNVNRVKIVWEAAYGRDYQVQIASSTSGPWTNMRTVTGNTTLTNDHTGLSGTGRYVRINCTLRGTPWGYSIFELEVYGTSASRLATSIEPDQTEALTLYPNPVETTLKVSTKNRSIKIYNQLGKEETFTVSEDENGIDVASLPAGIYTIVVKKGGRTEAKRFVKK
jgi:hypothetical protein